VTLAAALAFQAWAIGPVEAQNAPAASGTSPAAGAPAPSTPPADAQPADETVTGTMPPGEQQFGEEIVVTGSRIRRKDLATPAPITVISREQVQASGKVTIGDYLQSLPVQGNAINTSVNNGGDGSTRVNLRGLGDARTLVLVNGRRMVGVGTPQFTETTVDLNMIPSAAVERIEILKDGASAVYGSDAIGGVINVITRKNFNGTEVSAYTGTSQHGDGTTYEVNAMTGASGDRGHILLSAGFNKNGSVFAGDRSFTNTPLLFDYAAGQAVPNGSSAIPAGRFTLPVVRDGAGKITGCNAAAAPVSAAQAQLFNDLCGTAVKNNNAAFLYDPGAAGSYRNYLGAPDTYNFQPLNYSVTPQQRISLYSTGDLKLGTSSRGYFEASYVNRQSDQQFPSEPVFSFLLTPPVTVSANSLYNPVGVDLTDVRRRLTEFGIRRQSQDLDTFRVVTGLDGRLPDSAGPLRGWFWDTSLNYGRTQGIQSFAGALRNSKIADAVGPSMINPATGSPICVRTPNDPTTAIAGCVPLNLLHVGNQAITPDQVAGLGYLGTTRTLLQMVAVQFNTSGELFKLSASRPVGLALGYEFRREYGANIPDPVAAAGDSSDLNFSVTSGGFFVNEGYGELSVPIVNNLPYFHAVEASAATRVSNYNTFGTHATYKFGARWSIVPDVTLRGTYSTAFRAPSIAELFLGQADVFPSAADPCAGTNPVDGSSKPVDPNSTIGRNCGAAINNGDPATQLKTRNGGNPLLQPETARIVTAGVVLVPRWVKNLSVTVDYWNFAIDNSILNRGAGVILSGCLTGAVPAYCGLIHRGPDNIITSIDDLNTNIGNDRVDGIDLALRYDVPTRSYGRFGLAFDGTWLHKYDRLLGDGSLVHGRGTYDLAVNQGSTGGVYPEVKFNTAVTWGLRGLGAGLSMRYIGAFRECAGIDGTNLSSGACYQTQNLFPTHHVDAYNVWDGFVSYTFANPMGRTAIAAGVHNLFDRAPPLIYDSATPTSDPTAYDFVGRFFYMRLTHNI